MIRRIPPSKGSVRRGLGDADATSALVNLAANAGFTGADIYTAAAIAMAESGGNPRAYNRETLAKGGTPIGKGSFGLWQIYLRDHPEFAGWNLYDPQTNANAAFRVYQQQGWRAWTTYKTGAFRAYLSQPAPAGQSDSTPPLTIDASTGLPIDDDFSSAGFVSTNPVPRDISTLPAAQPGISTPSNTLLLTAAAVGLYFLTEILSD
jgi:hypothetical protein